MVRGGVGLEKLLGKDEKWRDAVDEMGLDGYEGVWITIGELVSRVIGIVLFCRKRLVVLINCCRGCIVELWALLHTLAQDI